MGSFTSKQEEKGFRKSGLNEAVVLSDGVYLHQNMKRKILEKVVLTKQWFSVMGLFTSKYEEKVPEKVVLAEWWFLVTGSFSSTRRERLQKKWS